MTKNNSFIADLERTFAITPDTIKKMMGDFQSEMKRGLAGEKSSLKMIPSFVERPLGSEKGRYLALDLGGTNLRLMAVELDGKRTATVLAVDKFVVENSLMCGTGDALFDFIAQCIANFLLKTGISAGDALDLAFTFSFPVEQTGIARGRLIVWTKGFGASGVVGEDVVVLLQNALARKGLSSIKIVALVNDTVGTLVAKSYTDGLCDMGVILGTGTNACYPEKIDNIAKNKNLGHGREMIINMEWGNFALLTQTPYDVDLDRASQNPGFHFLEKMVSGMYLGELTRRILLDMGRHTDALREEYSFRTEHMSLIASDSFDMLSEFGMSDIPADDKEVLRAVCRIVSLRSARIAGMAIASVIAWMDPKLDNSHLAGIDGSLFEGYPGFRENMVRLFEELFGTGAGRIQLGMAKDGSGMGAAITAAIASSINQ